MTRKQAQYIIRVLNDKNVQFARGLSDNDVQMIESKFDFNFTPDLKLFLQLSLPISDGFINWRHGLESRIEAEKIMARLYWPLEGMLFDLQADDFWIKIWGDKPNSYDEKKRIAIEKYLTIPKLIPIYSHRYIPSRPKEEGNPIFSVHQMDIIIYGYDLATYFANEFSFELTGDFEKLDGPKRQIDFWSRCVEGYD
jgi:hypothetical protein